MKQPLLCTVVSCTVALCIVALSCVTLVSAQAPPPKAAAAKSSSGKKWTPPRTPDGQPDMQGTWTNATITGLERPADLGSKQFFTPEEAAEYEQRVLQNFNRDRRDLAPEADVGRAYNGFWWDAGRKSAVIPSLRTSLIADPPDGKVPLMPEARKRLADARAQTRLHPADGPESRSLAERCLVWPTTGPPMLPSFANNAPFGPIVTNYQIVQAPGMVVIAAEINHDIRVIPVDGRPHLPAEVRQWLGDSRGHWEGNTLIVETTNFNEKTAFHGATANMRLVERFTLTDPQTIDYEFTVTDPAAFTQPWTASFPFTRNNDPIFEFACHEGNYGLQGMLAGARAEEARENQPK